VSKLDDFDSPFVSVNNIMRFTVSFIFVFVVAVRLFGQAPRFDHFDISNGLSQNNINGLVIDDKGNIWAGTLDGLNKFNGYEFEIFKPLPQTKGGISGNHVIAMGNGLKGDIWITMRDGVLNQYKASTNRFRQFGDEVFSAKGIFPANNLIQYNDSFLCFSDGSRLGVLDINKEECHVFEEPGFINGISASGDSLIVYGGFGIYLWEPLSNLDSVYFQAFKLADSPCFHLIQDDRKWYALSSTGIQQLNKDFTQKEVVFEFENVGLSGIRPSGINSFAVHKGVFWLGDNNLLVRIKHEANAFFAERFTYDTKNDFSFKGYNVMHLRFDELGNLWIGTLKNGLNHLNYEKNQFQHYNWNAQPLSSPDADPVRAICHRKNGDLWLGFDRNGVGVITSDGDQKYFSHYYAKSGELKAINNVRSIFEDSRGGIWIGESGELCVYNELKQRIEAVNLHMSWEWPYQCYSMKEFRTGTLTLTSTHKIGFVDLKTGNLKTFFLDSEIEKTSGRVRDVVEDKYGNLWISKDENGLLKINGLKSVFQNIRKSTYGLSDNKVYCMQAEGDSLWIGTNSGLNLFSISKDKIVEKYFEADGLCNNIIYSLNIDSDRNLWMSTNRGISRFNLFTGQFKTYLSTDFFMDDAHYVDDKGRIFYGGYTGVVAFHPDDIAPVQKKAQVSLEKFRLFMREIFPGDSVNKRVLFAKPLNELDELYLKYDENSFTINFNAYPFDYPNHNIFRYRLSGLQKEWTYSEGTNREAMYTVVPPGNYTFEVQAAFNHQVYGPVKQLRIEIVPPFWQTSWFEMILLLLLLFVVFAGYQIRLRQIRKRNVLLKTRVEEQIRELRERNSQILEMSKKLHEADQSKLRVFTNISHDFRTPLTLILAHLDNLNHNKNKAVRTIRNNALRLLNLINQLIDLRKLDQGELRLSVSEFDLVRFAFDIVNLFSVLAEQKEINLQFFSSSEKLQVWLDRDKMEKIVYNLLSNAIKYTPFGKSVMVSIEDQDDRICLNVEDEGIGMSQAELGRIFDRFYRSEKGQEHAVGHGIGLTIVKGLTEIQKGTVSIDSREGQGSQFRLTFFKGKDHFEETDFKDPFGGELFLEDSPVAVIPANGFSRFGGQKILVVEDNSELSDFLRDLLEEWFEVKTVENGKEAINLMEQFVPDLIISDVMMPVMDGIEFCRKIKADIQTSYIPFILLTARTDTETHIEGFELGIDDYIEKPFNRSVFLARLKALLENREKLKRHFEELAGNSPLEEGLSKRDREFIASVNGIIERRYAEPQFTVERLSEKMNMSRSTFYRKFKDLTGVAAADYIRKIRLRKAAAFLKYEEIPASQVAELVGFQSVAHFRKCFKDEFGETPGSWGK
jgi:signal transduction histidine kinase/DNA-binding response OmpR family regulator/ligand-binding sensor domain-containing protein